MSLYKGLASGDVAPIASNALDTQILQEQIDTLKTELALVKAKPRHDVIMLNKTDRQYVIDASQTTIAFNRLVYSTPGSNKFIFEQGGIKVQNGVKAVRVSLTLWLENAAGYAAWGVRVNTSNKSYNIFPSPVAGMDVWRCGNTEVVVPVNDGDLITAWFRPSTANSGNNIAGTYADGVNMIVEVIEYA